jgi:hypothetical protein
LIKRKGSENAGLPKQTQKNKERHKLDAIPNFVERIFEVACKAASKILSTKFGMASFNMLITLISLFHKAKIVYLSHGNV